MAEFTNAAAHPPNLGVVNCPADDASDVDVYFWDVRRHLRVRLWTSGCETASNGGLISPSISQSNIAAVVQQLTPGKGPSTVQGTILQFGGPPAADGTPPAPRPMIGIVAIYRREAGQSTVSGAPVAQMRTPSDGTYSFTLESGTYFVVAESLDGTQIVEPQPITLTAGGAPNLILGVDVP